MVDVWCGNVKPVSSMDQPEACATERPDKKWPTLEPYPALSGAKFFRRILSRIGPRAFLLQLGRFFKSCPLSQRQDPINVKQVEEIMAPQHRDDIFRSNWLDRHDERLPHFFFPKSSDSCFGENRRSSWMQSKRPFRRFDRSAPVYNFGRCLPHASLIVKFRRF